MGEGISEFRTVLDRRGMHAALAFLNARVSHRFTGIYRIDDAVLRNVQLFDRENPSLEIGADAPLRETYCSIVGETNRPFSSAEAGADERLRDHPARNSVISYCGVPIGSSGTLCHFDLVARPVPTEEIPVMEEAARIIARLLAPDSSSASPSRRREAGMLDGPEDHSLARDAI